MSFLRRLKDGFSRFGARFDKAREFLALVAGLALTLVAVLVARHRIDSVEMDLRKKAAPVAVVVASRAVPKGTALSEQCLAKLSVPSCGTSRRNVPAGEFELLLGARTKSAIEAGEPILWTDVEEPFEVERFSQAIPKGHRALTLEADLGASFSGLIRPGDRVDISCQDPARKSAPTWFYDVAVIAVDRHFGGPPNSEESPDTSSITVAVTPGEGKRLAAAPAGALRWFLRNPEDRTPPAPSSGTAPGERQPVEIWKAGIRETGIRTAAIGPGE